MNSPGTEIQLYQQLLDCLEEEWQALVHAKEETILSLASRKEEILQNLSRLRLAPRSSNDEGKTPDILELRRRIANQQSQNLRLINAALEVIQDFLIQLNASSPGLYQGGGKMENSLGNSFFHRHA